MTDYKLILGTGKGLRALYGYTARHRSRFSSEFGDEGFEEVRGGGARGGELRFQFGNQGHQLAHFGHDPALFCEGGMGIGVCSIIPTLSVGWAPV